VVRSVEDLQADPRRKRKNSGVRFVFMSAASLSIVISIAIIGSLIGEAWQFVASLDSWSQLWEGGWFPRNNEFSIPTILVGSIVVTAVAMVFAAPVGLGAAIYLAEYASPRVRRTLKPVLEMLAGIPSVVLGFFALTVIAPEFVQRVWTDAPQTTMLAAGLGVGILTVPLVATVSEDAMRSVPSSLREASFGLGARKMTTSMRVVVPAAVSGLVAAMILSISRALGETMVVTIAAGGSGGSELTYDPLEPGLTMTAAMATLASGTDSVKTAGAGQVDPYQSLFFVGLVLFAITLSLNVVASRFVARARQKY
jgi:phosphate transport system permease protein